MDCEQENVSEKTYQETCKCEVWEHEIFSKVLSIDEK
jgi:hypothetical protein